MHVEIGLLVSPELGRWELKAAVPLPAGAVMSSAVSHCCASLPLVRGQRQVRAMVAQHFTCTPPFSQRSCKRGPWQPRLEQQRPAGGLVSPLCTRNPSWSKNNVKIYMTGIFKKKIPHSKIYTTSNRRCTLIKYFNTKHFSSLTNLFSWVWFSSA